MSTKIAPAALKMIESNAHSAASPSLQSYTTDAFRMKAIRLLKDHGIYHSVQEIIACLDSTPLTTQIDTENRKITLTQELSPSPGKYVQLKGSFERRSGRAIPIKDSFSISVY